MNDTKVQRYDIDAFSTGPFMSKEDGGDYILHADHARIVAELDEKNDDLIVLVSRMEQREQELRILLAKYQRLHAADVAYDEAVDKYMSPGGGHNWNLVKSFEDERRLAMEALATHPQEPTK